MNIKKADENEARKKILIHTEKKLLSNGFYKFSMDELAKDLNISKKTLYKSFGSKEDLIRNALTDFLNQTYGTVISVSQAKSNVIEKFISFSGMVEHYFRVFNDNSLDRLKKKFPELGYSIDNFRNKRVLPLIKVMLKIGKKKKLITDIPDEIILKVFVSALGTIAASRYDSYSGFTYNETFKLAFDLLLNGILTKKGRQVLTVKKGNYEK